MKIFRSKKKGLGEEDLMHKYFGALIKKYELMGLLECAFWSYDASGENRNQKTGALLKSKGLRPGQSDYFFKAIKKTIAHYIHIEFKTKSGKLSVNQKLFRDTCSAVNEFYYVCRSVQEAIEILIKHGVIKEG